MVSVSTPTSLTLLVGVTTGLSRSGTFVLVLVYYETIKRNLNRRLTYMSVGGMKD